MSEAPGTGSGNFVIGHEAINDRVELLFYFGPHRAPADARNFESYLADADVYMPELHAEHGATIHLFQQVAKGNMKAYNDLYSGYKHNPFTQVVLGNMVARRKKLELFVADVPGTPYWRDKKAELQHALDIQRVAATVDRSMELFAADCQIIAKLQDERDVYIADNITKYLNQRVESDNLPPDRPLKVIASLGSFHTKVIDLLAERGIQAQIIPESKIATELRDDIVKLYQEGKEPDRELLMRAFLGGLCIGHLKSEDSSKRLLAMRKVGERLPADQLEALCESWCEAYEKPEEEFVARFEEVVAKILSLTTGQQQLDDTNIDAFLQS
nr:Unknown Function [uncultured bacterium]